MKCFTELNSGGCHRLPMWIEAVATCQFKSQYWQPINLKQREMFQHLSVTGNSASTRGQRPGGPHWAGGGFCIDGFSALRINPTQTTRTSKQSVRCDVIAMSITSAPSRPLQVPRQHHWPECPDTSPPAPGRSPEHAPCDPDLSVIRAPVRHIRGGWRGPEGWREVYPDTFKMALSGVSQHIIIFDTYKFFPIIYHYKLENCDTANTECITHVM